MIFCKDLFSVHYSSIYVYLTRSIILAKKVLACLAPFMNVNIRGIILIAFIESQFGYCPIVFMFHSRSLKKIECMIALRIANNEKSSSLPDLFNKDDAFTVHHRNIRNLAIELYKFQQKLSPPIFNYFFCRARFSYNLRGNFLSRKRENSVRYGIEWECPCILRKAYVPRAGFI